MSVLEKLWRGALTPCDGVVKEGSEYQKLHSESTRDEERFREELTPEVRDTYDAFCERRLLLANMAECDAFIQGFRLGMLIAMETLGENSPLFQSDEPDKTCQG